MVTTGHPGIPAVMVKFTVCDVVVALVSSEVLMSPVPLAGNPPTLALSRVQLKTTPGSALDVLRRMVAAVPAQTVWLIGVATATGIGDTITLTT